MKINQAEFLQSLLTKGGIDSYIAPSGNDFAVRIDDSLLQEEIFNLIFSQLAENPVEIIQYFKWNNWDFIAVDGDGENRVTCIT